MGKKGRRCKTRWRRLPMGGDRAGNGGDDAEDEDCGGGGGEEGSGECQQGGRCPSSAALGGRERAKGGGSDGAASPLQQQTQQNGPRQASTTAPPSAHHAPYKGGARGSGGGGRGGFGGGRRGGAAVTDGGRKGAGGGASVYTFNEEEYTKITTPRQDVLFKKGYLMARKKEAPTAATAASTNGSTTSSAEVTNGESTPNGTSATHNGDASSSSDQTYSAHLSGSGAEDDGGGGNGYAYVNGYTNGYSYGGGYHMDQSGAMPNGGAYFVNGGSYELYDPYAAMAAAAGYAFPYVGAPPPHQPPPHTISPLQAIDWYASRPPGSTGDVQWCHVVASPGYSETRRKRYSTDSQNCSPPSSESTGPPGSPQEEVVSSSGGDPCHTHQPIPQYHHAHVFQGPHPHAAAYVYPGYLFGPAVYSVNGVPLAAATPIHPLHGLSQSIHVHPSAAVAAPGPVSSPQGGVPSSAAPGSDGGSQRRRKKKRRRKRKRGLTDDASEETSSEVGEEEGGTGAGSGSCGACSAGGGGVGSGGGRGEEFEEDEEEEDEEGGAVVVVRLGNVVPLVMSQGQPPGPPMSAVPQPYVPQADVGPGVAVEEEDEARECSSTDCSELSGHPESSSSTSGGELEDQGNRVVETVSRQQLLQEEMELDKGVTKRDADVSVHGELTVEEEGVRTYSEKKIVSTDAETREVWTQSPPEVAVQVGEDESTTTPPSPTPIPVHEPEVTTTETSEASPQRIEDDGSKECSKNGPVEAPPTPTVQAMEPAVVKEKPQEAPKHKRRNGRGKNNKFSVPEIHSLKSPADEPKSSAASVIESHPAEVVVLEAEAPEPVQFIQQTLQSENTSSEPVEEIIQGPETTEPPAAKVEPAAVLEEPVISSVAPTTVEQVAPAQAQAAPQLTEVILEDTIEKDPGPVEASPEPAPEVPSPAKSRSAPVKVETTNVRLLIESEIPYSDEPAVKPASSLPVDTFTFKPEPYKHPMLKSPRKEIKEEPLSVKEVLKNETNGNVSVETEEEKVEDELRESSPPSRHLQDMPRRKARLKKPPEREKDPDTPLHETAAKVENDEPEMKVVEVPSPADVDAKVAAPKEIVEVDNKNQGEEGHRPVTPVQSSPTDKYSKEETSKEETLTEVVSKWLEENSDALPESLEEMKGEELKKTEEGVVVEEGEGNLTGSKNGVGNPFPAPSNRLPESERKCVCERERVCVCDDSNACVCAFSGDGPVKRVANRNLGGDDVKTEERRRGREKGKRREGGRKQEWRPSDDEEDDQGSCEWEPMTVEAPKRIFADLESWKRHRGGLGGSSEALRSLGSYRGTTDDEDDEEVRKARLNMCDPSASVAKYYCLGASRVEKSPSPVGEVRGTQPARGEKAAPTDSGVQTDEEEDSSSVATAEEAKEDTPADQRKGRRYKTVGLGKTAAFVVRQIGTTESAKGPFPCGICCIIQ